MVARRGVDPPPAWPAATDYAGSAGDPALLEALGALLGDIRKAKTEAGVSLRAAVSAATVSASDDQAALIGLAADDLRQAGVIAELRFEPAGPEAPTSVDVRLAEQPA